MKRRILLIAGGLLLSVATLAILWHDNGVSKLTVSFVNAEASFGPGTSNDLYERLAFAVRNDGRTPVPFVVSDIKDERGNWLASFHKLDDAEAGKTTQLYLYLPKDSHPQAVRLRGYKKANTVEKAQYALKIMNDKIWGRYKGKQVWFKGLSIPAYQFVVTTDTKAELGGAASGNQSSSSEINGTSSAAGARR